jgi:hypothetical protein
MFHCTPQVKKKNVRQSINNNNHYIKISFHPIYHPTTSKNMSGRHIIFKGKGKIIFVNNEFGTGQPRTCIWTAGSNTTHGAKWVFSELPRVHSDLAVY